MASITYDGQSLQIDGRRIWIVSGSLCPARIPKQRWSARIHAARQAGLNAIEVPLIWARHEPRQGQFDFQGDNDIRHFVQLVGQAGMVAILRPGPYVGMNWDLGGLPPWLLGVAGLELRTASRPFLEACSKYINAIAQQLRELQVSIGGVRGTSSIGAALGLGGLAGMGGPILMLQNESGWFCGDDNLGRDYLGELNRYFREAGFTVPIFNANELWQGVEGEIDSWTGFDGLLPNLRQLSAVREAQPRYVSEFHVGTVDRVGTPLDRTKNGPAVLRRLAEVLAAGGQLNIAPFCGGTNFGFGSGRMTDLDAGYPTTSNDQGAPITEGGRRGDTHSAVRRISMFASRFSRILANLEPRRHSVSVLPTGQRGAPAVCYSQGAHGAVAFAFGEDSAPKSQPSTLLFPDGTTTRIDLGREPVAWYLYDARVSGKITVDYSNLSPFALLGQALVMFGPPGFAGIVSINGSSVDVEVPRSGLPQVFEHEGVVLIVANTDQLDQVWLSDDAVFVGVQGVEPDGTPTVVGEHPSWIRVSATGEISQQKLGSGKGSAVRVHRVRESHWKHACTDWVAATSAGHASGASARFASIAGPADLLKLGSPYGYGWYRLSLKSPSSKKHHVLCTRGGDRFHMFLDGESQGVWGDGPGASRDLTISLRKGAQSLVILAENAGRSSLPRWGAPVANSAAGALSSGTNGAAMAGSGGSGVGATGVAGHLWSVVPVRGLKPKIENGDPVEFMKFRRPLWRTNPGDCCEPDRLTYHLQHKRKTPLFLQMNRLDARGLVFLNGTPIEYFDATSGVNIMLPPDALSKGKATIQVALDQRTGERSAEIADALHLFEGEENLTEKAEWAFAKWEPPGDDQFKANHGKKDLTGPLWWRTTFTVDDAETPIFFDAAGLTKGQIFINGRHLCRYFVATSSGKPVPPQTRYFVPRSWLTPGETCTLMIFDEHGANPSKTKLAADPTGRAF